MKLTFERGALTVVGLLVVGLMGAVFLAPPDSMTASPRAILRMAASAVVPPKVRPEIRNQEHIARKDATSTGTLSKTFQRLGYDYESLLDGRTDVPRIFLATVPGDLGKVREIKERKTLFLQSVLPLVLQANEDILADRKRIWSLRAQARMGERLDAIDRLWLAMMAERYRVERDDLDSLLLRVDAIPPSLALAQAAAESGWGTSRFVREGNALFGQWTTAKGRGLTPLKRDAGLTHKIKVFDSLLQSVEAYVLNLNTHRAYKGLRKARAAMRTQGAALDGHALAGELIRYSERGLDYVVTLRSIIEANNLKRLDGTRLKGTKGTRVAANDGV